MGKNTIFDLHPRLQILEDKLSQYEKHYDETKHCNTLENTFQELSNLVKKKLYSTKSIERTKNDT